MISHALEIGYLKATDGIDYHIFLTIARMVLTVAFSRRSNTSARFFGNCINLVLRFLIGPPFYNQPISNEYL